MEHLISEFLGVEWMNDAINMLGELALNPKSSMGTEKMAKQTLAYLLDKNS